jgi:hypothetical protein
VIGGACAYSELRQDTLARIAGAVQARVADERVAAVFAKATAVLLLLLAQHVRLPTRVG